MRELLFRLSWLSDCFISFNGEIYFIFFIKNYGSLSFVVFNFLEILDFTSDVIGYFI